MSENIELGAVSVIVVRKDVKNVHLAVHPPDGRVSITAPHNTNIEVVKAYTISKLTWIKNQREQLIQQARESKKQYVDRESHYLWGKRYLLKVNETVGKQGVKLNHKEMILQMRPKSTLEKRQEVLHEWYKLELHNFIKTSIAKWAPKMGVNANAYFLRKMKTKWGSCNPETRNLRFNTELVKKPKELVEYVVVHELAHLISPKHDQKFVATLDQYYPHWREARLELNELALGYVEW